MTSMVPLGRLGDPCISRRGTSPVSAKDGLQLRFSNDPYSSVPGM